MLMRGLSRRRCFINNRFMITAKNISAETNVRHAFFTRQGGVSDGIYGSLNCGPGSSDKRDNVIDNRARAMACLDQEPEALVTAYQYHSAEVVMVDEAWALGGWFLPSFILRYSKIPKQPKPMKNKQNQGK